MTRNRRWMTGIGWVLVAGAMAWLTILEWTTWYQRLLHFAALMAILSAAAFLPPILSWRWRIACFVGALGLAVIAFWARQSFYVPVIAGAMVSFILPVRKDSNMTMRQAWQFLRNSSLREQEASRAIIARHLEDVARQRNS